MLCVARTSARGRRFSPSRQRPRDRHRAPGKWLNAPLKHVLSGRRYYSPSQGRFLGRDPKQEGGGRNLYAFTMNNPVNGWDYLGMEPWWIPRAGEIAEITEERDGIVYRQWWEGALTGREGVGDETEWSFLGEEPESPATTGTGGNATRGMPENPGLYGTGLAMIPALPFFGTIGPINAFPPSAPARIFEFIHEGVCDGGGFNLYMGLRYRGSQALIVETTVTIAVDGMNPRPIGPIYTLLDGSAQRFPVEGESGLYPQITPLGPGALLNAMRGIDRATTSGVITVQLRYAPKPLFSGGPGSLSPVHASFFENEKTHNPLTGSTMPGGFNPATATTETITIGWGPNGLQLSSHFPGGPNRVDAGGIPRECPGTIIQPVRPPYTGP